MKITILTLFPDMFSGPFKDSIIKIAQEKKLLDITFLDIRNFGIGSHSSVDDTPYGGGVGMVMRVDVVKNAIDAALDKNIPRNKQKIILTSASGKVFNQNTTKKFAKYEHLIIICGHYEGIDTRIEKFIDEEISIGDFVLTGGEIPAMLIVDAITRLIPGVLKKEATINESFEENLLEGERYTKPNIFEGLKVPDVLLSGDHKKIEVWRKEKSAEKTRKNRPDLLKR